MTLPDVPAAAGAGNIRPVLLGRAQGFFLNLKRSWRSAVQTVFTATDTPRASASQRLRSASVASGFSATWADRAASWLASLLAGRPRPPTLVCPVLSRRATTLTT